MNFGPVFIDHDHTTLLLVPSMLGEDGDRKDPWSRRTANQNSVEAGCAYLEITLMNFDDRGAVNFFAIIIGHQDRTLANS